jgi:hypothetical protein
MRQVVTLGNWGLQVTLAVGFFGKWIVVEIDFRFSSDFVQRY